MPRFRLPILLFFFLFSSLNFASASKLSESSLTFRMDSHSPKPTYIFVRHVVDEFKRLLPLLQEPGLSEHVSSLLYLTSTLRSTAARVKNFYALEAEKRREVPASKETYYLVQVAVVFARHDPLLLRQFVKGVLATPTTPISEYLILCFKRHFPSILANALCEFMLEGKFPAYSNLLEQCPNLINMYADPEGKGRRLTPLAVAVKQVHFNLVNYLVHSGADVNAVILDDLEYGPIPVLFCALASDSSDVIPVVDLLVRAPNFDSRRCVDSKGTSPVNYLIERNFTAEHLDYLASIFDWKGVAFHGSVPMLNSYCLAIAKNSNACAQVLEFQEDFEPNFVDAEGASYLMLAGQCNNARMVKHLITEYGQQYCQLRPGYIDKVGRSALILALQYRSYDALKVLVHFATEFEINDKYEANVLAWAIFWQDLKAIEIILSHPEVSLLTHITCGPGTFSVYEYAESLANQKVMAVLNNFIAKSNDLKSECSSISQDK